MDEKKDGARRGNVVRFADYQKRKKKDQKPKEPPVAGGDFDEATRDLHAAASTALKLVHLVRIRLGLPGL